MTDIRLGRILLADDGSDAAAPARAHAVELAISTRAKLSIVYVLEPLEMQEDARQQLGAAIRLAEANDVTYDLMLETPLGVTNPGKQIVRAAEECGADLIVLGARGLGGIGRLLLGSVSTYVAHHATCPVLIAR